MSSTKQIRDWRSHLRFSARAATSNYTDDDKLAPAPEKVPGYINEIGCPVELPAVIGLGDLGDRELENFVRRGLSKGWMDHDGILVYHEQIVGRGTALRVAGIIAGLFVQNNISVGWRSLMQVLDAAPRYEHDAEDKLSRAEEFELLTAVFELLVITGVQLNREEDVLRRVLDARSGSLLPTVIVAKGDTASGYEDYYPVLC